MLELDSLEMLMINDDRIEFIDSVLNSGAISLVHSVYSTLFRTTKLAPQNQNGRFIFFIFFIFLIFEYPEWKIEQG